MFANGLNGQKDAGAILKALNNSLAIIEFDVTGKILSANSNFCSVVGYEESEIVGKHHRIFVDRDYANSSDYEFFWDNLSKGQFDSGEYKRFKKDGSEVWIQASYNPILGFNGKPKKVVKFASDITNEKQKQAEAEGISNAISRSQAVIEFDTIGNILNANENFCQAIGYSLQEIVGQHHSMFVEESYAASAEYKKFWHQLAEGEFSSSEFKRIGKGGKEIHIQASYNPIFSPDGRVVKVIKFATDVTPRVTAVNSLGESLKKLAEGNLSSKVENAFEGDLERLRCDFNTTVEQVSSAFSGIFTTSEDLTEGIRGIASASINLSQRTENQAAALEQTASTLCKITETVQNTSHSAANAKSLVESAKNDAQTSEEVVQKTLTAMKEIENSGEQISQILSVIDEIAFQTNLLALNAGVEAARAGEAGGGFAVVANEVRELAQRSGDAAKEIKQLILQSNKYIEDGSRLVDEASVALQRISEQVINISDGVEDIANGASEQSDAIQDLNASVSEMDSSTQQNAVMAEEATAACNLLKDEAIELDRLMRHFQKDASNKASSTVVPLQSPSRAASTTTISKMPKRPRVAGNQALATNEWEDF